MLGPTPDFKGAGENPNPGIEGATKSNDGSLGLSGADSLATTLSASTKEPGHP